jgi:NTE family protein
MAGMKTINLALQGGGAHGAFGWGVLDRLVEDERLDIDGISATSAGSINAVVYAHGRMQGDRKGARDALEGFWRKVSESGQKYSPLQGYAWTEGSNLNYAPGYLMFESMIRSLSPYQFNPFDFNPLREVLAQCVDFGALPGCKCVELFISATNVRTGKIRVFRNHEVTLDSVMASACLPQLFRAVKVDGEPYWDGGFMGNPALFPLFYHTQSRDVVIVHINPIERPGEPMTAPEIQDRVNEITFNSSLLRELRVVAFVTKMIDEGWVKDEYLGRLKRVLMHSISADDALLGLPVASKLNTDWTFLSHLRDLGRDAAGAWLEQNYKHLGERSTVDLYRDYLDAPVFGPVPAK